MSDQTISEQIQSHVKAYQGLVRVELVSLETELSEIKARVSNLLNVTPLTQHQAALVEELNGYIFKAIQSSISVLHACGGRPLEDSSEIKLSNATEQRSLRVVG